MSAPFVALHEPSEPARSQGGIALVAVLWMTAALAILVAGMSFAVRIDTRLAADHVDAARARALLDGGLRLAAAELSGLGQGGEIPTSFAYPIGEVEVRVEAARAGGFININNAPETLLADLFRYGAGLPDDQALTLAQRIIDWRDADDEPQPYGGERDAYLAAGRAVLPRNEPFRHPEDLGQVLGMEPSVHDKIAGLITAIEVRGGAGLVDPMAAPSGVLGVLARGNSDAVERLLDGREAAGRTGMDLSALEERHVGEGSSAEYRLLARLEMAGGVSWSRAAWISTRPSQRVAGRSSLPWMWLYAESPQRATRLER